MLASASDRRREILERLGLAFDVRPANVLEVYDPCEAPARVAVRLAVGKAVGVPRTASELVLGADTLVAIDGQILGKPTGPAEARSMVARLAGRSHRVHTGLALVHGDRVETAAEETRVWFRSLEAAEVAEYVATGEPFDKAGGYGVQGFGAAVVERIAGDFFNVMGLPVQCLLGLLRRLGFRYAFGRIRPLDGADARYR